MYDVTWTEFGGAMIGFILFFILWSRECGQNLKLRNRVDGLQDKLQLEIEDGYESRAEIQDLKDQRAGLEEDGEYDLEIELDLGDYEDGDH